MAKKTNKTSHVLNLITNGEPLGAEESQEDQGSQQEPDLIEEPGSRSVTGNPAVPGGQADFGAQAAQGSQVIPGSQVVPSGQPAPNSQVVTVNLAVTGNPASTGNPTVTVSQDAAAPSMEPDDPVATDSQAVSGNLQVTQQSVSPSGKKVTVVNGSSENDRLSSEIQSRLADELREDEGRFHEEDYRMVNVMEQILMRQKLEEHMKRYEVCQCSRCRADVSALILTRLPAKYVVIDSSSVTPIIGFYESKFKIRILTEIIKACVDVKENPRHNRGEVRELQ